MRKSIFILLAVAICSICFAEERTEKEAAEIAASFTNNHPQLSMARKSPRKSVDMRLVQTRKQTGREKPAYYVFNQDDNSGFVIVSGDDRTDDVLVYSNEGSFNPETVNPNFRFWLDYLAESISTIDSLDDAGVTSLKTNAASVTEIKPLLGNTAWEQGTPYNNLCPIDIWDNTRSYTGCVATAAAQIMRKWEWPKVGVGSKTYTWENYAYTKVLQRVELTANFGETEYDWDNMLDHYQGVKYNEQQALAVATLMYHCGVACEMMYGGDKAYGSGSFTELMADGLNKYFSYTYDRLLSTYSEREYTSNGKTPMPEGMTVEWKAPASRFEELFNADLEAGRPIILGGVDSSEGGHEFVCDGRDADGKFHINWGWEGVGNSYCSISLLRPKGESANFSSSIDALIGLEPVTIDTVFVTGVELAPEKLELKINEKQTLAATVSPQNATVKRLTWHSGDSTIAVVNSNGKVRGVSQGTTVITVTTVEGGFEAQCAVTVTNEVVPIEEFTLVTDINELSAGDELIMVALHSSAPQAATKNISANASVSYMGVEKVSITENTITLEEGSNVAVFTLAGNSDAWTLTNQDGALLGTTAVKKLSWTEGVTDWNISISDTKATIVPVADNAEDYGRMIYNYNNGNPRMSLYTSNTSSAMLLPQIYARPRDPKQPAALDNTRTVPAVHKLIRDGRILIIRDGVTYDILGRRL